MENVFSLIHVRRLLTMCLIYCIRIDSRHSICCFQFHCHCVFQSCSTHCFVLSLAPMLLCG